jgi:serine/threonine-protein kinase HipA
MSRAIRVHIGETPRPVGLIRHDAQGARENAAFEYDASWLSAPDRFAIDPALPLLPGPQFHRRSSEGSIFHSVIADTEPDGWGKRVILRDHAKRRQDARSAGLAFDARPPNQLDFLLAVDDFSRVGALRFQDEDGVFQRDSDKGRRTAPPLIELDHLMAATRAVETNSEAPSAPT